MGINFDNTDSNTATKQVASDRDKRGRFALGNKPRTGFHTNPERRNNGSWHKEDTARYKLEQMMILTETELSILLADNQTPLFERRLAQAMIDGSWAVLRDMMNEVYGKPKESIELSNSDSSKPIIKGFVIPTLPEHFIDNDIIQQLGRNKATELLG